MQAREVVEACETNPLTLLTIVTIPGPKPVTTLMLSREIVGAYETNPLPLLTMVTAPRPCGTTNAKRPSYETNPLPPLTMTTSLRPRRANSRNETPKIAKLRNEPVAAFIDNEGSTAESSELAERET